MLAQRSEQAPDGSALLEKVVERQLRLGCPAILVLLKARRRYQRRPARLARAGLAYERRLSGPQPRGFLCVYFVRIG